MMTRLITFLTWTLRLVVAGVIAGVVAYVLTQAIHFIQALSFGYQSGSFSTMIATVAPERRFLSLLLAGAIAGLGWQLLAKKAKPIQPIQQTLSQQKDFSPWSQFCHGWLQLITVSMGAPVGREGASREVAVALTAACNKAINTPAAEQGLLLACASGAALGAVYQAPLATIVFIIEAIVKKCSVKHIYAAAITAFTAVQSVLVLSGHQDIQYLIPPQAWQLTTVLWAIIASPILAFLAFCYQQLLKNAPKAKPKSRWFIPRVLGAFGFSACLSLYFPEILGNGKAGLLLLLHHDVSLSYTAFLLLSKAAAVYAVFASGAKGGKIAPSMMLGGASGLLLASLSNQLGYLSVPLPLAIVIGATLFLGIINQIPLTAPFFLIEITEQPLISLVPLAIVVLTSYLSQQLFQTILSLKKDQKL
ncbi:TPA: chloride channel protein [Streptococcus equi subsp. zooepidemicus]|uniref:chloride channel protein n=1 Tax=Streptococcus equi TaxID=1336 RepID=UPI0013DC5864|nr:chloride channel protein [Streptococcus equi]MDI5989211.1 chloride channel protein [Streptococcus equi subsp. zooepidemicus]HEL0559437.1 chloride channel protein [Streptococcus equi subsp. zooepidemicus]HEL0585963.1 chloride channel protein [Streptococcus equi subsp. zooepidemicus]HEL0608515.1 chloride channel protein [Streptococcus equi subsp. zooepidemicus]HEL0629214.1 chloride channel protein [Streptococcus equi subsp. zooepidemicus]